MAMSAEMMPVEAMSVTPRSPALGAAIAGVDLRKPLDAATVKAINDAFERCIEGQALGF